MRRRWNRALCGLLISLASGCDAGGDGASTSTAETTSPPALTTSWSADTAGTSQVPTYGNSCRFEAANHLSIAGNSATDDSLELRKNGNFYALEVTLDDGAGGDLNLSLSLEQGLSLRSFRNGTGISQAGGELASLSGEVQDAALCFESKLAPAEQNRGEFSVVVLNASGEYVSLGGDFELAADSVFPGGSTSDELMLDASGLLVDLE